MIESVPSPWSTRPAAASDAAGIRHVLEFAFPTAGEANLVEELRASGDVRIEWVAEVSGEVIGQILFGRLLILGPADAREILFLAPVSVLPEWQGRGVGSDLLRRGLAVCRQQGELAVIVLGDPKFCGQFGFDAGLVAHLESVYAGPYLQGLEFVPETLSRAQGRLVYPTAFASLG